MRFWASVCKMVRPMLSVRCLSCLSCPVCNVRALWPNGWTDQDETWQAGRPRPLPNFWPISIVAKRLHASKCHWYRARPRPRRLCVRWGPRSPVPQRDTDPQFQAHICCGQMAAWTKMSLGMALSLGQGDFVLDGDPSAPSPKGGRGGPPNFRPMFIVTKRLDG